MKIKPEHYQNMLKAISTNIDKRGYEIHKAQVIKEGKAKDVAKRMRWDLMHCYVGSRWLCDNLYSYLDDSHIDTALRRIVANLQFEG